jgi:recombination protein RecA
MASPAMASATLLRAQIEMKIPAAFSLCGRSWQESIPTGIASIDDAVRGIPLHALTEICGSNLASSGKTSLVMSLLSRATQQENFCALIDGQDAFDPASAEASGVNLSRLLWVRCGKTRKKLRPLEQAFKVADVLLQSAGFGLILVDLSDFPEKLVRKVPHTSWFRFSRVVERQPTALVFVERAPHATSCAGLVLSVKSRPAAVKGNLFTQCGIEVEILRTREKKPPQSERPVFSLRSQWA